MYHKLEKERVVYCDVDDTLLLWEPSKYKHKEEELIQLGDDNFNFAVLPHHNNIAFLMKLKAQGYGIVIWSAAGAEWAERVTKLLKLEDVADFVMAKPEICLDDLLDAKRIIKSVIWIDPDTGEFKRNA